MVISKELYEHYGKARRQLKKGTYDLAEETFGKYVMDKYSTELTVRDFCGILYIDFDVYNISKGTQKLAIYCEGATLCMAENLPFTKHGFWKLVQKKVDNYIAGIEN